MEQTRAYGRLFLVPAPLDFGCASEAPLQATLPEGTLVQAAQLQHWVCENAKSARAYLKRIHALHPLVVPLQAMQMQELPREVHKKGDWRAGFDAKPLLQAALQGHDMGLLSEAGMPAVADPGSSVVRAAHLLGIQVVPLVGPVSLLLALASSGLHGQSFAFVGYVPVDAGQRAQTLQALERQARQTGQTQIMIETPYRNTALLQALLHTLAADTWLSTASGLTLAEAALRGATIKDWKKNGWTLDNATPTVFCLGL